MVIAMPKSRNTAVFLALAVVLGSSGCEPEYVGKTVVVFVDASGSVKDFKAYMAAWERIKPQLRGGDRLIVGKIGDHTETEFTLWVDRVLPPRHWLTDNKLDYEKDFSTEREKMNSEVTEAMSAFSQERTPKTEILGTLTLAEKFFDSDQRRPVLVLLSDMLEDSGEYDFERTNITPAFTQKLIEAQRTQHRLPNLRRALVYVAGASAKTPKKMAEIETFWIAYAQAVNADLRPYNYGPALLTFSE
jgi:hypothetical protein